MRQRGLGRMPKEWRRALRLRHAAASRMKSLRKRSRRRSRKIERILEYAREHLRQSLIESGCTFIVKGSKTGRRVSVVRSKNGRKTNG